MSTAPSRARLTLAEAARLTDAAMDACNLSGLAHDFPRIMEAVWDDVNTHGGGTESANRHPLAILWLQKMTELAGLSVDVPGVNTIHHAFVWLATQTRHRDGQAEQA